MQQQAHPWHGISQIETCPQIVIAYVEIVPTDTVKYEIDKASGHLKIDRPQKYSNLCPSLYGFLPKSYCKEQVAEDCMKRTGLKNIEGDGDPLDICILTEKTINHGDILVYAKPVGGFRMIDKHQADDKIIAVLKDDSVYGGCQDISEIPKGLIERLKHYF